MQTLRLRLSDHIEGTFQKKLSGGENFFVLNKDFHLEKVLLNNEPFLFLTEETESNVKKYIIPASSCGTLTIRYCGVLDGQSGAYPYVREKTSDEFYLLREETRYYPLFYIPDTIDYINHLIQPQQEDRIDVSIELQRTGVFVTNLGKIGDVYSGYNPTIAVGHFEAISHSFGTVFASSDQRSTVKKAEGLVRTTNDYMNRYLPAEIRNLKIVIIPDHYGSFVLPGTLFLEEKALSQPLFPVHELIHTNWNPKVEKHCQRTRFFDEALTQYFALRVLDASGIQPADATRQDLAEDAHRMKEYLKNDIPPLSQWGVKGVSDLAYSLGPIILLELEEILGRDRMDNMLRRILHDFRDREIDFEKMLSLIEND